MNLDRSPVLLKMKVNICIRVCRRKHTHTYLQRAFCMINCSVRAENSLEREGQSRGRDGTEERMNWKGMEEY